MMKPSPFMFIHGLTDPNDPEGRTYKQVNAAKTHTIPIGALVEDSSSGVRLFVVGHHRDCDMTPLYSLSYRHPVEETEYERTHKHWHGHPEYCLTVIKEDGRFEGIESPA